MEAVLALGDLQSPQLPPRLEVKHVARFSAAITLYLSNPELTCMDIEDGFWATRADNLLDLLGKPSTLTSCLNELLHRIQDKAADPPTEEAVRAGRGGPRVPERGLRRVGHSTNLA